MCVVCVCVCVCVCGGGGGGGGWKVPGHHIGKYPARSLCVPSSIRNFLSSSCVR